MRSVFKILAFTITLLILGSNLLFTQTVTIWNENFSSEGNGATTGNNDNTVNGANDWTTSCPSCNRANEFRVQGNRFEVKNTDEIATWTSEVININGYINVSMTVDLIEFENLNVQEQIRVSYRLNGGPKTQFNTNGFFQADFGTQTASQTGLTGNNLVIIIDASSGNTSRRVFFDNINVTGVLANGTFVSPSLAISDNNISVTSNYTFTQTVPTDATNNFGIASGATVTLTVPNGDLSTVTTATIGGAGATITSQTATTIQLTMPAGQAEGATFDIVLNGVTNFSLVGIYATNTVSVPNIASGTNSFTTYSYTLVTPTPGSVSANINLWLKANSGALNGAFSATNGQFVNTWQDQSGIRVNDATDINLAPPRFRNNVTDNINFNPIVDFDGINDGLDFGNDYIYSSGSGTEDGMTWFAIVQPDNPGIVKSRQFIIDFGFYASRGYGFQYGNSHYSGYTSDVIGGAYPGDIVHGRNLQTTLTRFTIDFNTNQTFNINGETTPSMNLPITLNGLNATTIDSSPTHLNASGPFTVGQQSKSGLLDSQNGRMLDGSISEIIGFSRDLTINEIVRVESYLAIKYGITLNNSGGGTAGDYQTSSGNIVWDASLNVTYHNDIAGIARDDNSLLDQRESKSVNSDAIVTIGLDTITTLNTNHTSPFLRDSMVFMWGNNNGSLASWVKTETQSGYNTTYRMEREWLVKEKNGDVGDLKIRVDSVSLPIPPMGPSKPLYVVVDEDRDGDFSTGNLRLARLRKTAGVWQGDINLADGEYFTFMYIHFDMMRHGKFFFNRKEQTYQWYDNL